MENVKSAPVRILSVHSGKGGTGKTSLVSNLGAALSSQGIRTLVVDMDFFTRGLSYFLTKGDRNIFDDTSSMEQLIRSVHEPLAQDVVLHSLEEELYLLPASDLAMSVVNEEEIERIIRSEPKIVEGVRNALLEVAVENNIRVILIDARSGVDLLSLFPALVAHGFIVMAEEDLTSQRSSMLLLESVEELESRLETKARFLGFILNMITISAISVLVPFYEQVVLNSKCIATIPLSREVRQAFVREQFVVRVKPRNWFSQEIVQIAKWVLSGQTESTAEVRAARLQRIRLAQRLAPAAGLTFVVYVQIAILLFIPELGRLETLAVALPPLFIAMLMFGTTSWLSTTWAD